MEDVAVLFFDADKDGDLDLFIGAGGNYMQPGVREAQHRLYKNDGQGHFSLDVRAFPGNDANISVAQAEDYDGDGDLDLFVGGRSVPFSYGVTPRSYIYNNDGQGHFTDVTEGLNKELAYAGMVTGARWSDVDGDKKKELIVAGEWMAVRIFKYEGGKFRELKSTGLEDKQGWWQMVETGDLNGDGNADLVLGNIGENFYLRPDREHPVKLWLNDFDGSGTVDQFLTRRVEDRDMPVFLKREITEQFPALKKGNLKHAEYAKKSVQELFSKELVSKARVKEFNYCQSVVAYGDGKGHFEVKALPQPVQLSGMKAALVRDLDGDGKADLLTGGNLYNFPPQFGRLDGNYGTVLLNRGGGNWELMENSRSGLLLRGEVKDIRWVNNRYVLVLMNNRAPVVYEMRKAK